MRETLWLALFGLALGLPGVVFASRLIASQVFGIKPWDPVTFMVACTIMAAPTIAASYIPARLRDRPHRLPAESIQSPYIHSASSLAQSAVSTRLRLNVQANRDPFARRTVDTALEIYRRLKFQAKVWPIQPSRISPSCSHQRELFATADVFTLTALSGGICDRDCSRQS
jgi:hypothetical protein